MFCRTLSKEVHFHGVTLFTGVQSSLRVRPFDAGIAFRSTDNGWACIDARASCIIPETRRTVLDGGTHYEKKVTVQTVEHLLSALAGMRITGALIDFSGPEIPILDGSALPFVEGFLAAGFVDTRLEESNIDRSRIAVVTKPIVIDDGKSRIEAQPLSPADRPGLYLTYHLQYPPGAPIPPQEASIFLPTDTPETFPDYATQIAPARTFALAPEAQAMRAAGMFTHLTPREMLVIGPDGPIDNAYRFPDEPARHKLLDLLGDISLAARPIQGRIIATRTGHAHNHAMARAIAELGRQS